MNPIPSTLSRLALILVCSIAQPVYAEHPNTEIKTDPIESVLKGEHRPQKNKARDQYRHAKKTLKFFGLENNMTVVEIWPGGGWYTEILAPLLRNNGQLYAAHFSSDSEVAYFKKSLATFNKKIGETPNIYDQLSVTTLQPPNHLEIAPENSADRVFTFRNVHNWMKGGQALTVFKAMFRALKPGGVLGIVEHRGIEDQPQDPTATSGYVTEAYVKDLAKQSGFVFIGSSEINANPNDSKNHPKGVWTLPPSLRLKEVDQEKYLAIGESDRMTLKFAKPANDN